jgi:cell division protein FtsI/penicillin-binding protein 2
MYNDRYRWRLMGIAVICLAVSLCLAVKLFSIQILRHRHYAEESRKSHEKWIELKPQRGIIYDSNMIKLACNIPSTSLFVIPCIMKHRTAICAELGRHGLGAYTDAIKTANRREEFRWVARKLSFEYQEALDALKRFPELRVVREQLRYYPFDHLACHVLGFCNVDGMGIEGLERNYDDEISGEFGGWRLITTGNRDFPVLNYPVNDPKEGKHLILTLNSKWQRTVEGHLEEAVTRHRADGGTVIIENARTGAILSLANFPVYNSNSRDERHGEQVRNDAIFYLFECGSTLKIIPASCALEENLLTPNDLIYCEAGSYRIANHVFHDDDKRYGWLSFREALARSSNIALIKVARMVGSSLIYRALADFGFGTPTVLDLPGERSGTIPPLSTWNKLTLPSLAIGHGISVTAMQLVNAYACLANGGSLMQPFIVSEVIDNDGRQCYRREPLVVRRVISPGSAATMVDMLTDVVETGTGREAFVEGVRIAGKTGTGQIAREDGRGYIPGSYNCSFVGILPDLEDPLVIGVIIRNPKGAQRHAGEVSAPVFREIVKELFVKKYQSLLTERNRPSILHVPSFECMNLSSARALGEEFSLDLKVVGDGEWIVSQTPQPGKRLEEGRTITLHTSGEVSGNGEPGIMPSLRGLSFREAISRLRSLGFKLVIFGRGRVVDQHPSPGEKVRKETMCTLIGES